MIRELIEQAKTADKAGLIQILADLGVKADNRKGEDTLRAETLAGLEQALTDHEKDTAGGGEEGTSELSTDPVAQADVDSTAPVPGSEEGRDVAIGDHVLSAGAAHDPAEPVASDPVPPDLGEDEVSADTEAGPVNRLLRNTNTGAEFVWTTELAKLSHMVEV